jgi:acyl-CoA synthetase (AMP-forming)/AMP-acid ligase II
MRNTPGMGIAQLLEDNAKQFSNRTAIIFKEEKITFEQVKEFSLKLANGLRQLGITKGDRLAIYLPNCPEYFYCYLAAWSLGATCVPLDYMLTQEELISCISHSEAKLFIAKLKPAVSLENIKNSCNCLENIVVSTNDSSRFLPFEDLLQKETYKPQPQNLNEKDYAIIFYTSGTTGKPKGVLINYPQLEGAPQAMEYFVNLSEKDTALCALPLSHFGGLVFLQGMLFLGTRIVLMERFTPIEFLKNVQNHKVGCFWLVPSMYYAILQLKEFEIFDLSSLKWVVSFGAPSSADQLRRFHQYCSHASLINGWGMTETQGPTVVLPNDSEKIESVGLPAPWIEIKIFDDNDKEVETGQVGEIVVRSWIVADGYYKDPEATAIAKRNGWFHTGDLGRLDNEKFLFIVGRKKEMIKVGGEIVFEPEVEAAIHKHPDIAEVSVIGVSDKLRGEVPKAFVVLKEGRLLDPESLRYFCRENLAHFKIPHHFEFVSSLPKNRAGKIDKAKLRRESDSR